jgi:hypothetical protein
MTLAATPLAYLDKALGALRDLGLVPERTATHEAPIVALLQQISDLDEERDRGDHAHAVAGDLFHDVVRVQVEAMDIGDALRAPHPRLRQHPRRRPHAGRSDGGRQDHTRERLANVWMKVTRGDIAQRFERIKRTYLDVTASARDQLAARTSSWRPTRTSAGR